MEQIKRFGFLVSNGSDFSLVPGFGDNTVEAKEYVVSGLHRAWFLVEDKKVINDFVEKNNSLEYPEVHNERLLADLNQFKSDLLSLEETYKEEETKMTIEEKMVYVRKALAMGASVDLNFHNIKGKAEAKEVAMVLSELSDLPHNHKSHTGTNWYKIKNEDHSLTTSIFYDDDKYMIEDIWGTEEDQEVYEKQL